MAFLLLRPLAAQSVATSQTVILLVTVLPIGIIASSVVDVGLRNTIFFSTICLKGCINSVRGRITFTCAANCYNEAPQNTPKCTILKEKKSGNFLGRGHSPLPDPTPSGEWDTVATRLGPPSPQNPAPPLYWRGPIDAWAWPL